MSTGPNPTAKRASATRGLLVANIAVSGIIALLALSVLGRLGSATGPDETNLDLIDLLGVIQIPLPIATGVAWLMWQHRAQANLHAAGIGGLKFTPGWAVGYWFVPIVNLVRPYQSVKELWSASDPGAPDEADWQKVSGAARVGWWWLVLLASNLAGVGAPWEIATIDDARRWLTVTVVGEALSIAAAALAISIVMQIQQRQQRKFSVAA